MYDHALRHPKKAILLPLAKKIPASPNQLTAIGLVFGLTAAFCSGFALLRVALFFWTVNRILDGLDGEVARAKNLQTDMGGYLDILADLLVYAAIPIGLACSQNNTIVWLSLALMLASFYLNVGSWMFLSSILEKHGQGAKENGEFTTVAMPRGLIEGGETILFFTLFLLYPAHLTLLFTSFSMLTFLGAGLRVKWAMNILPQLEKASKTDSDLSTYSISDNIS